MSSQAPEDALVIAEVFRRLRDAIGRIGMRADGTLNQGDVYAVLSEEYERAQSEAVGEE